MNKHYMDYIEEAHGSRDKTLEVLRSFINEGAETQRCLTGVALVCLSVTGFNKALFGKKGLMFKNLKESNKLIKDIIKWNFIDLQEEAFEKLKTIEFYTKTTKWLVNTEYLKILELLESYLGISISAVKAIEEEVEQIGWNNVNDVDALKDNKIKLKEVSQVSIVDTNEEDEEFKKFEKELEISLDGLHGGATADSKSDSKSDSKEKEDVSTGIDIHIYTCIDKIKGKSNRIISYKLQDELGVETDITADKLKDAMREKKITVSNLRYSGGVIRNK